MHDDIAAHAVVFKTKDRLARRFNWPGCYKHIENFLCLCDSCQRVGKSSDKEVPMKLVPIIGVVFSKINIDACGGFVTSE